MAIITSGAPTSETAGNIGDHLVDSTTGKVYECISVNTYGGHDAVTFKRKKTEYVWKCIGDDPNYGSALPSGGAPYQQLVTDGDGNTKWEDRLAYEVSVTSDIAGLEYTIDGFDSGTYTAEHSDIPLELGQVWSVTKITAGGISYEPENVEVQKDEDGTLYIGFPPSFNVSTDTFSYSVTKNKTILSWYWYTRSYIRKIKLVGVSGTHTNTTLKQIDQKFLPVMDSSVIFWISYDSLGSPTVSCNCSYEELKSVCINKSVPILGSLFDENKVKQLIYTSYNEDDASIYLQFYSGEPGNILQLEYKQNGSIGIMPV